MVAGCRRRQLHGLQDNDSRARTCPDQDQTSHACCHQDMCNRKPLSAHAASGSGDFRQKIETFGPSSPHTCCHSNALPPNETRARGTSLPLSTMLTLHQGRFTRRLNKNTESRTSAHHHQCNVRYAQSGSQKPHVGHITSSFSCTLRNPRYCSYNQSTPTSGIQRSVAKENLR